MDAVSLIIITVAIGNALGFPDMVFIRWILQPAERRQAMWNQRLAAVSLPPQGAGGAPRW